MLLVHDNGAMSGIKLFMGQQLHRDDRRVAARIPRGATEVLHVNTIWRYGAALQKRHPLESESVPLFLGQNRDRRDRRIGRPQGARGEPRRSEIRGSLEGRLAGKRGTHRVVECVS